MANCNIKIWSTEITPEKNGLYEDLSTYLGTLTPTYVFSAFQYQKIELDLFIKLPISQANVGENGIGNYLEIEQDSRKYYYFILDANWTAENTVQLQLSIDSINTFAGEYELSEKTNIIRQHKDRYVPTEFVASGSMQLKKVIDRVDEGFSGVATERLTPAKITDSGKAGQKWYLVYSSEDDTAPITVDLYPENRTAYKDAGDSVIWDYDGLLSDTKYIIFKKDNPTLNFEFGGRYTFSWTSQMSALVVYRKYYHTQAETHEWVEIFTVDNNWNVSQSAWHQLDNLIEDADIEFFDASLAYRVDDSDYTNPLKPLEIREDYGTQISIEAGPLEIKYLQSIDTVDRSSSKITQIVELPYAPDNFTWSGNNMNYDDTKWHISGGKLRLIDYTEEFERTIRNYSFNNLLTDTINTTTRDNFLNLNRSYIENTLGINDPKLLKSEFYTFKLVYDIDSKEVKLERVSRNTDSSVPTIDIKYKPSNTLSNQQAFKWSFNDSTYFNDEDFSNILLSNKDTSIMLYNNAWLTYTRNGKKWDYTSAGTSAITTGLSTATGIISAVKIGKSASNAALATISKASTVASIVTTVANGVASVINNYNQLAAKREELKAQAPATSGNTSIDIFNWYDGNALYIIRYEPTREIKEKLNDLFHYCGYSVDRQGLPVVNTRYWFNFIQADIIYTNEDDSSIWNKFKEDIKSRYANGLTVFHYHNGYDFNQEKENWENFF